MFRKDSTNVSRHRWSNKIIKDILGAFRIFIVAAVLILFPLQNSYEIGTIDVKENDHMPKIGFYTVGDNVTIALNFTNHSNETRYLKIVESFGPYSNPNGPYPAQHWQDISSTVNGNSTITISHTFVAIDPEVWELIVDADGFNSYNLTGVADPYYSNQYDTYVHPSSDRDIRVLAESMHNSSVAAGNNLNEVKQQGNYILLSAAATAALAVATVALAISGFRQTQLMNRNVRDQERLSRLAYGPWIWPRFEMINFDGTWRTILFFENMGNGAAINVDIEMTLASGQISRFRRFALSHHLAGGFDLEMARRGSFGVERHNTGINLNENPRIPAIIRYQDVTMERHEIRGVIIFENNEVRFEMEQEMVPELNNGDARINRNDTNEQLHRNLTLDSIHFGGLIALGATIFSVGAALWITSADMLGHALDAGASTSYSFKIMSVLQQMTPLFLYSGFVLIIAGFVVPWIRLRR